ncbi:hypothetical protein BN1708_003320, partial [Verticillium longisporum]
MRQAASKQEDHEGACDKQRKHSHDIARPSPGQ